MVNTVAQWKLYVLSINMLDPDIIVNIMVEIES